MDKFTKQYLLEIQSKFPDDAKQELIDKSKHFVERVNLFFPEKLLIASFLEGIDTNELLNLSAVSWGPLLVTLSVPSPKPMKKKMLEESLGLMVMMCCGRSSIQEKEQKELAARITKEILEYSALTDDYATTTENLLKMGVKAVYNSKPMRAIKRIGKPVEKVSDLNDKRKKLLGIRQALIRYILAVEILRYSHERALTEASQGYRSVIKDKD